MLGEHGAQMITDACSAAGVELGGYDKRIIGWLASFDPRCAPFSGLITRARKRAGHDLSGGTGQPVSVTAWAELAGRGAALPGCLRVLVGGQSAGGCERKGECWVA